MTEPVPFMRSPSQLQKGIFVIIKDLIEKASQVGPVTSLIGTINAELLILSDDSDSRVSAYIFVVATGNR